MKIILLDCTLRDGGYINDWLFGHDTITNIFERLVSSKVDVIEIGFLDERRPFDMNRSIMPDTASVEKIYGHLNRGGAMIVGMIDYGTCNIEHLQPASKSYLDGIRVIFKKHVMHEAFAFCKQVKDLGYRVFAQAVSITSYNDDELLEFIGLANEVKPYAVSMVDTYGLLHQNDLAHVMQMIDKHLDSTIVLGYHAHNNFQMGYANAISVLNSGCQRDLLVDGTLYGMGKSAGNAPLELLGMYMNSNCGKQYDISQMLEAIQSSILDIYKKTPWGYNMFFYIAASNKVHPSYVSYLMNKRTLSITAINEILQQIEESKKLLYDARYIEKLYLNYQKNECDDTLALSKLSRELAGKKVLVFGPGTSVMESEAKIKAYIEAERPTILSINYIPAYVKPDYLFLTNSRRYVQLASCLTKPENCSIFIIATSNVTSSNGLFAYKLNYSSLIDERAEFPDNSLIMLLKVFIKIGVKQVALVGFDGYTPDTMNYFDINMEYSFVKEKADSLNAYGKNFIARNKESIQMQFVTKSHYCD
jgi:4-hydroxy 2-oxovalerate aldolase